MTPLTEPPGDRLVTAMPDVDRFIFASRVRVEIIDPRDIDADPARSISANDEEMTLPNELLLIANLLGAPVGCGALKLHIDTQIAEVKRMWVRGLGLGRRVLERLSAGPRHGEW